MDEVQEYHITAPYGNSDILEMNGVPLKVDEKGQVTPEIKTQTLLAPSVSFLLGPRSILFAKFSARRPSSSLTLPWYLFFLFFFIIIIPGSIIIFFLLWILRAGKTSIADHPRIRDWRMRAAKLSSRYYPPVKHALISVLIIEDDVPHEL